MTKMTWDVLHRALAQGNPHGEGQRSGVHLLVAFCVEELAAGGVLAGLAADALQADGGQEAGPHRGVIVGDVHLPSGIGVAPVALLLLLLIHILFLL